MIHWGDSFASDATILRLFTEGEERRISLVGRRELKIGSSRESDLVLDGPEVAAEHCRIYEQRGRLILVDRGSRAGTLINGQRCVQPTELREGDRIEIDLHILELLPGRAHLGTGAIADKMALEPQVWNPDDAALRARFVHALTQAAAAWEARARPARLLLRGDRLARAVRLPHLPTRLNPWIEASARRRRRRQGLRWLLAGLLPGLLCGSLLAAPAFSETASTAPPSPSRPADLSVETPPPPPPPCNPILHEVIPHETLDDIARRYDVDGRQIVVDNNLGPGATLERGMTLKVCTHRPRAHRLRTRVTPREGDTWESLARRHGLSPERLRQYNDTLGEILTPDDSLVLWVDVVPPALPDHAPAEAPSGASSAGKPGEGALEHGAVLRPTEFFDVRCGAHTFVSTHTMRHVHDALFRLRDVYNYHGQIVVGDASRKGGGKYGKHLSHQSGRDVDIWLPIQGGAYHHRKGSKKCGQCGTPWCRPDPAEVDFDATYQLVRALHDTAVIQNIFLDRELHAALRAAAESAGLARGDIDRLIQRRPGAPALVTHIDRHKQHIHVRFRCGPDDANCRN